MKKFSIKDIKNVNKFILVGIIEFLCVVLLVCGQNGFKRAAKIERLKANRLMQNIQISVEHAEKTSMTNVYKFPVFLMKAQRILPEGKNLKALVGIKANVQALGYFVDHLKKYFHDDALIGNGEENSDEFFVLVTSLRSEEDVMRRVHALHERFEMSDEKVAFSYDGSDLEALFNLLNK